MTSATKVATFWSLIPTAEAVPSRLSIASSYHMSVTDEQHLPPPKTGDRTGGHDFSRAVEANKHAGFSP
jgi:hypothetical protein